MAVSGPTPGTLIIRRHVSFGLIMGLRRVPAGSWAPSRAFQGLRKLRLQPTTPARRIVPRLRQASVRELLQVLEQPWPDRLHRPGAVRVLALGTDAELGEGLP